MSTTTTNYGLIKPGTDDPILVGQLNDNADAIDAALKENADAIENKPDAADIPAPSTTAPAMDGTGSAGTSSQYARADHVHPSDTSKQNALSTAQLAAVNSGINSTKVAQIETNKNNISINRSEIADIVDNGAKNIAIIVNASQSNMTASVQSDGYTIAITGNNQTGNKTITWGSFTVPKTGAYAVDYEITGTGGSFFIVDETIQTTVREYYTEHSSYYVESLTAGHNYSIRTYRNGAIDTTISLLICNESARIISDKKVPYCPSLAELYALVKSYHSGS